MSTAPFPKPLLTELVSLIDTVLNSINPSAAVYLNRNTVDAAYAGYVFSLLLAAAERVADTNTLRLRSTLAAQQQSERVYHPGLPWSSQLNYTRFRVCILPVSGRCS